MHLEFRMCCANFLLQVMEISTAFMVCVKAALGCNIIRTYTSLRHFYSYPNCVIFPKMILTILLLSVTVVCMFSLGTFNHFLCHVGVQCTRMNYIMAGKG
ncbi:hypothetical protein GDO78_000981 [Eleutherodactylus coqui]|uniref:Uncharacterized protein n=1 Tax=Eleutherodactylus coqui TaxID=57060 RepID=A0A8J6FS24_ELECQ|nr:hypothetical protein GDO78_000981 [Eleutherodactylus coqui]